MKYLNRCKNFLIVVFRIVNIKLINLIGLDQWVVILKFQLLILNFQQKYIKIKVNNNGKLNKFHNYNNNKYKDNLC